MASQPANVDIKVHRRVRSYRQMIRHNNVKAMCNRMRPLIMSVPSRETQILSTFDGDANIVQTNLTSNRRGLPIVRYLRPVVPFETAAENIAMGAMADASTAIDVEVAARGAGAHDFITRLPQGYDTLLGKWFSSGTELSGGEWQRLALARAYLRRAQIIILDEPTSFMDSWAEADWFDRLQQLADGRTAIVITHRFTIAKRADEIHVMDDGQIVESGSHDELLAKGGMYARSWTAQMQARTRQPKLDIDHAVLEMPEPPITSDTAELSRADGSLGRP